jgi:hypothetical protein
MHGDEKEGLTSLQDTNFEANDLEAAMKKVEDYTGFLNWGGEEPADASIQGEIPGAPSWGEGHRLWVLQAT